MEILGIFKGTSYFRGVAVALSAASLFLGACGNSGNNQAVTVRSIDFCRLQFPTAINDLETARVDVFGRVFSAGLTDMSGVNDLAPELSGAVGYGPDGSNPASDPGWVWSVAMPNAGYGPASLGYEANNDEYMAALTVPGPPGNYDFAFRFSGDLGATFTYCDGGLGTINGYAPADAGQLVSLLAPIYFSEYLEGSSNNKALEIINPSAVSADLSNCVINQYANGSQTVTSSLALTGILAANLLPARDVVVLCNIGIDAAGAVNCDLLSPAMALEFNGNDAIELACNATVVDVIGQIGFDPVVEWFDGIGTQNETLRRACSVVSGDKNGADAFLPSAQWEGSFIDDFSDLGRYICP